MAPNMLIRAAASSAVPVPVLSATMAAPSMDATAASAPDPVWNGTIPKGWLVCDSSEQALTLKTCNVYGGFTQVQSTQEYGNVTMCLLNISSSEMWSSWLLTVQEEYNISWTPPKKALASGCNDVPSSAALALDPRRARTLVFVLGAVAILTAL